MKKSVGMQDIAPALSKPLPSVRRYLVWLVLACFFPGLVGGTLLLMREYRDGQTQLQVNTLQMARALVQAVDAQLDRTELLAQTLATSDELVRRDFAGFHQRALRLISAAHFPQSILIFNSQGQQIVNSRVAWGQALPQRTNLEQIQHVFASGKPAKPEVVLSPLTQMPVISIAVPVFSGARVDYVLVVGISPEMFNNILTRQALPPAWATGVLDNAGTIAARSRSPEKFVGLKTSAEMRQHLLTSAEGSLEVTTREGIQAVSTYSRSTQSGWAVGIGIPRNALEAELRKSLLLIGVGATLLLGLTMGLVWFFGGRIAASVLALRTSAATMGNGAPVVEPKVHLKEAQVVARAITNAARALRERNQALTESHDALLAREAELAEAQRIARIGSWSWNSLTKTTWASESMCQIFGLQEIPPFEAQNGVLFAHEAWIELRKAQLDMAHTGQDSNLEVPALHADGHQILVSCRSEVWRNPAGERVGYRGMVQDVTERKRRDGELAALRTQMQNMMEWQVARHTVAALAHEINQPLASVSVLCEAASRMLASEGRLPATTGERPKQLEQTLQRMASETERAGTVVRQLMKSVHRPDIALAPVMLCELLHAVARMFLDENAFDCQIDVDCSHSLSAVPANRLQLTKVLMNLIGNSAQAMKNAQIVKGKISIGAALAADGATVVVSVRDTGPGISARMQQEIFQPFVTTKSDGLGMGLTISRTLIELHGGTLRCESQAPAGALFRFTLPVSKATL